MDAKASRLLDLIVALLGVALVLNAALLVYLDMGVGSIAIR